MSIEPVEFQSLPWVTITAGAREKRVVQRGTVLRLLEFSPPFVEHDWCVRSHAGYVVEGAFAIQFRDRTVPFVAGDGILIAGGEANAHKAIVDRVVLLFLVEADESV